MRHNIIGKRAPPDFQSDKYTAIGINKIVLSFKDPAARRALYYFADYTADRELADDIREVLNGREWTEVG